VRGGLVSHDDGRSPVSLRLSGVDPGVHLVFPRDALVEKDGEQRYTKLLDLYSALRVQ
jgi:hypothetical protein